MDGSGRAFADNQLFSVHLEFRVNLHRLPMPARVYPCVFEWRWGCYNMLSDVGPCFLSKDAVITSIHLFIFCLVVCLFSVDLLHRAGNIHSNV